MKALDPVGRVFVVTGAGNGIGRRVAMEVVSRGGTVAGADLDEAGLRETAALVTDPARFSAHVLDVSDSDAVAAFPEQVLAAHGRVDGLFNIAGIAQEFERVGEVSPERMELLFRVNFFGSAWLTTAFLPHLRTRPRAVVEFTSSLAAIVPVPGSAVYGATKSAVAQLAYGLAQDLRQEGRVSVTVAVPGSVWTDLVRKSALELGTNEALARRFATMPEVAAQRIVDATLHGKARAPIGKDAHVYGAVGRVSTRLADRLSYLQVGGFMYNPAKRPGSR